MKWNFIRGSRRLHRWAAILIALPFLIVIVSGILLQVKKEVTWVQPKTETGSPLTITLSFDELLSIAQTVEEAEISSWEDIERIDMRPEKGIAKIRSHNNWEIQVDTQSGDIKQVAYRRSHIIESLHDGSFFSDIVKNGIFLPTALIVLSMWVTGMYLYFLPKIHKRRNRKWLAKIKAQKKASSKN